MRRFFLTSISVLLSLTFGAGPGHATYVREFVLDNGLKVLLLEDHKSPAVTFQVWYRVGSRNEKDGKSGLAHFLEHMMFKGTPKTEPEEYSRIIAKNGGRSNAFTSTDVTVYFATMSREKIGIQLELEAERMTQALLRREIFRAGKESDSRRAAPAHRRQSGFGAGRSRQCGRLYRASLSAPGHRLDGGYPKSDAPRHDGLLPAPITRRTTLSSS